MSKRPHPGGQEVREKIARLQPHLSTDATFAEKGYGVARLPLDPFLEWVKRRLARYELDTETTDLRQYNAGGLSPHQQLLYDLAWPQESGDRRLWRWREMAAGGRLGDYAEVEAALDAAGLFVWDLYAEPPELEVVDRYCPACDDVTVTDTTLQCPWCDAVTQEIGGDMRHTPLLVRNIAMKLVVEHKKTKERAVVVAVHRKDRVVRLRHLEVEGHKIVPFDTLTKEWWKV